MAIIDVILEVVDDIFEFAEIVVDSSVKAVKDVIETIKREESNNDNISKR